MVTLSQSAQMRIWYLHQIVNHPVFTFSNPISRLIQKVIKITNAYLSSIVIINLYNVDISAIIVINQLLIIQLYICINCIC